MHLRFALAFALLALGSLVLLPAPLLAIWILTLLVTEWGHWLALMTLVLLIWTLGQDRGVTRLLLSIVFLVAISLFSVPFLQATRMARDLPEGLAKAFGPSSPGPLSLPIQFTKLWLPSPKTQVETTTYHYQTKNGRFLALDFCSDSTPGRLPCIVVVHGGSWQSGDEKQLSSWNPILAGLGYRVASIAYRLAPQSPWPAQKEDLLAAISYLKSNAPTLGIDPGQFVLLGRSAGAQIVLATAYAANDSSLRGCIASYPPTDMNFDYGIGAPHSILDAHKILSQFLGGTPEEVPSTYRDASALALVSPNSPPTLIAHGTRDELVWIQNSRKLRDRLQQYNRPVYLLEMPWATHGFDLNPSGPGGQMELYAITWFLGSVVHSSPLTDHPDK